MHILILKILLFFVFCNYYIIYLFIYIIYEWYEEDDDRMFCIDNNPMDMTNQK